MGTYTLTRKARADLKGIAAHTQKQWGREQRRLYVKQFDDAFQMLASTPKAGTSCEFIKHGYRKFPNGSHVIFYRELSDSTIEVVRILHKRMDITGKLGGT
jgi:toxin ParE1/3/4